VAEEDNRGGRLDTWQEIATYLGVTPRTAQTYRQHHALPVYQLGGSKSRVVSYTKELDGWQRRVQEKSQAATLSLSSQTVTAPALGDESGDPKASGKGTTDRRQLLRYALLSVPVCGVGGAAAWWWLDRYREPTALKVTGTTISALGEDGTAIWRYSFPKPINEDAYSDERSRLFADLDGDGRKETLFNFTPRDLDCKLVCFDHRGHLRWQFIPGRDHVKYKDSRDFGRPYMVCNFALVPQPSSKASDIAVTSVHEYSFLGQVALIDGRTGKLKSDYWHRGQLNVLAVADLDGDGEPEILAGGVNDAPEYKQATMVVLDHRRVSGSSKDPAGAVYYPGMPPANEKAIVFFPRTPVSVGLEFNRVRLVRVTGERITIEVSEGISAYDPYVVYEMDFSLRVRKATLSDQLNNRYVQMQLTGVLPKEPIATIEERLASQVKVLNPGTAK
jgi:hypothetical protein